MDIAITIADMQIKNPTFVVRFNTADELSTFKPSKKFVTPKALTIDRITIAMCKTTDVIFADRIKFFSSTSL